MFPSYSSSAMSEAVSPDTMGGFYGEKPGDPVVDFSYVGIDAILEQMRRKAMKQGFELNIMVVGKYCLFNTSKMLPCHRNCASAVLAVLSA